MIAKPPSLSPILALAFLLVACSGDPGTGPVEVKWDRDVCERCRMVLSDRLYSAQVRGGPAEQKTKAYRFDDIGCAMLWLEQQPWRDDPRTEIWVNDYRTGTWIDARTAHYVKDRITPMAYGLGAQSDPVQGGLNYEQARQHVHVVEQRFNSPEALNQAISREAVPAGR
jgi:nitrous oxide reductase accessory protein NosL